MVQVGEVSDFLAATTSHTPPSTQHEEAAVATKRRRTLVGIPYEVSRGQGGWELCQQAFSVRGSNYLNDNVKVLSVLRRFFLFVSSMIQNHRCFICVACKLCECHSSHNM